MATLGAPRTDHRTPATGTHAHEKAVAALAPHNGGLVGAFHGKSPEFGKTLDYNGFPANCQGLAATGLWITKPGTGRMQTSGAWHPIQ
mgnify:CR=1 FL=1